MRLSWSLALATVVLATASRSHGDDSIPPPQRAAVAPPSTQVILIQGDGPEQPTRIAETGNFLAAVTFFQNDIALARRVFMENGITKDNITFVRPVTRAENEAVQRDPQHKPLAEEPQPGTFIAASIEKAFQSARARQGAASGGTVFIYFSGHGSSQEILLQMGRPQPNGTPERGRQLTGATLGLMIDRYFPDQNVVFITEGCQSGGFCQTACEISKNQNFAAVSAATQDQPAKDVPGKTCALFGNKFFTALSPRLRPSCIDQDGDKKISLREAFDYCRQLPGLGENGRMVVGRSVFERQMIEMKAQGPEIHGNPGVLDMGLDGKRAQSGR